MWLGVQKIFWTDFVPIWDGLLLLSDMYPHLIYVSFNMFVVDKNWHWLCHKKNAKYNRCWLSVGELWRKSFLSSPPMGLLNCKRTPFILINNILSALIQQLKAFCVSCHASSEGCFNCLLKMHVIWICGLRMFQIQ